MENEYNNENKSEKITIIALSITGIVFFIFVILIFLIASKNNTTDKNTPAQIKKSINVIPKTPVFSPKEAFGFTIIREIGIKGNPSKVKLTICLPKNVNHRQKISNLSVNPSPSNIIDGNMHKAVFNYNYPPQNIVITYKGTAVTQTYTLDKAKKLNKNIDGALSKEELKKYTSPEKSIESDDLLIKRLEKTIPNGKNREETVKNIFDFVAGNLTYDTSILNSDRGAFFAASNGKGTCMEYSSLFVAICRAKKIPSRVVKGFNLPFTENIKQEYNAHAWVEVYFDEYGWVNFDPTISYSNQIMNFIKDNNLSFYDVVNKSTLYRRYLTFNDTDVNITYETKSKFPVSLINYGEKITFYKVKNK